MVIYGFVLYICYFVTPLHHENKTSVEFILTNLFGYLIRTGCTGTPGTKAPMEVKRAANKHLSFILFVLFVLLATFIPPENCSVPLSYLFSLWRNIFQNEVKSLSDTIDHTMCYVSGHSYLTDSQMDNQ